MTLTKQPVVVRRHSFAQFINTLNCAVGVIVEGQVNTIRTRRRPFKLADLRLTLTQIDPIRVAHAKAELHRLHVDADHPHERQMSKD